AQGENFLTTVHLPDLHRLVVCRRRQLPVVRAERHAAHRAVVSLHGVEQLAGSRVPHANGRVVTGRGEQPAVGARGHAVDATGVVTQSEDRTTITGIPNLNFAGQSVASALEPTQRRGQPLPVRTEGDTLDPAPAGNT